jgi:YHS domain-containing protein
MATAIDPICKMEVDTGNSPGGSSEHRGDTYYFCAPGCKAAFDRDPEKYLANPPQVPIGRKASFFSRLIGRG